MSLAKGDSSSGCKGKEVATNNLPTEAMGGKAPHSELDHSKEEEWGRDSGNKCPPFIDLWYDTHIHFPVVPND